jgi:antibiotic biosynthesis monooxygenase (ABM) superfamily enzyme
MYARIGTSQLKPGTADRLRDILGNLQPELQGVPGMQGGYALVNRETNRAMTIALFDTKEHAQAYGKSAERGRFVEQYAQITEGDSDVTIYEVLSGV